MSTVEKQPRGASAVEQFTIHIPGATLDDMYERLRRTRYPEDFANDDWEYGFNTAYLRELVDYWITKSVSEKAREAIHHCSASIGFWSHLPVSSRPIRMKSSVAYV